MKKTIIYFLSIMIIVSFTLSCKNSKVNQSQQNEKEEEMEGAKNTAGPPVIIYKTKDDYFDKVPVTLSEDKSEIASYPGIKDVFLGGEPAYPTNLNDGFLLDNRGVDKNSAFLNLTYEEYSKLKEVPSLEELNEMIIDRDPFTELYHCGSKFDYKDVVKELNEKIDEGKLDSFEKMK